MKNLTRVLALVLTFAMMISTVAMAATFTDIEEGSTYAEATAVLADLGILKGYEDGTFGADKVITRAEVVAVVNRLQGLSDAAKAAGTATQYTDVPSTEWYAGDVNLATQMGIISGDGNGLFRPEDQVKYEEAVKMIIAALGYNNEYVMRRGGWPTGYLVIATETEVSKGLTAGAGEPAYRGIVAKLAYNALTAPRFTFKEYSDDGKAVYEQNKNVITLEENLHTQKFTGMVVVNSTTSLIDRNNATTDNDVVNFRITTNKIGKYMEGYSYEADENINDANFNNWNSLFINTAATDIADTLGYTIDVYVTGNDNDDWEVVSYVVNKAKNNKLVIEDPSTIQPVDPEDVEENEKNEWASDFNYASEDVNVLSVFDEEVDTVATTYNLAKNAVLVVNGENQGTMVANAYTNMYSVDGDVLEDVIYAPKYGTVTLLDNNNNNIYDYVFVDSFEVAVIDDVIDSAASKKIYTVGEAEIDLTNHIAGKKGYTYSITLDGEEATIADLQKDDVIAVAMSSNKKDFDIRATRNTVSGIVSEVSSETKLVDKEFVIDGTTYKVANLKTKADSKLGSIKAGDEVTFYLDAFNNVALTERTSSAAKNYAFIVGAGEDESVGDVTYQVRLLDKDGNIATYPLADKVRSNLDRAGDDLASEEAEDVYDAILDTNNGNDEWIIKSENPTAADIANYAGRIVTYKANSSGKLTEIVFGTAGAADASYLTNNGDFDLEAKYNAKTYTFINNYAVSEDTVVFNLPINDKASRDAFEITTIGSLSHDQEYAVAFLSVDEDAIANVMVVVNNDASVAQGSNLAVATKVMSAQNEDYASIFNITFLQNGELQTLATTEDVYSDMGDALTAGVVFEYSVDDEGAINAIALGTARDTVASYEDVIGFSSEFDTNTNAKEQYVFGYVYSKNSNRVITLGDDRDAHAIPAEANFYLIDLTKTKNNIEISSIGGFRAIKVKNGEVLKDNDYCVFMKYYNDEITDVVIYKGLINKGLVDFAE